MTRSLLEMTRSLLTRLSILAVLFMVVSGGQASASHNQVPPHVAAGAFVGTATTGALSAPVSNSCGTPVGVCAGGSVTWTVGFTVGAGGHYSPPGAGQNPVSAITNALGIATEDSPSGFAVQVGTLSSSGITGTLGDATGGFGGWCGYSSGSGGAGPLTLTTIVNVNPPNPILPPVVYNIGLADVGWQQSAATVIVFHGNVANSSDSASTDGTIDGVVSAVPPIPGVDATSCLAGTASSFRIVGGAVAVWQDE